MSAPIPRTERLHRKIAAALRQHGDMTISQLRIITGYPRSAVAYVLHNNRAVDGVSFRRVGTTKYRGHEVYIYGLIEVARPKRTQLELLDRMGKLAKEIGRLYRTGRRDEAMEAFDAWQALSEEFRQNAQNGQI